MSGYNSSQKFQFPSLSEIINSELTNEEMETEIVRNKRSRDQI